MDTSQTPYQRALSDSELRAGDRAFFATQHQEELHQLLLDTFLECERGGMKRADLARRSGHSPAVITRLLTEANNYRASTVAVLMAAMGYEIDVTRRKIRSEGRRHNDVPALQRRIEARRDGNHISFGALDVKIAPPSSTAETLVIPKAP